MTVTDLLELLRGRNVELRPEKGKLKVHAPAGVLTDELKALIRERKDALLDALMPRAAVQVPPRDSAESAGDFPVGSAPLSFAQKRLWFLNQLDSGGLYNVGVSFSIGGELDIAALEKALNAIVSRHSVLRTVYDQHNGEPFQKLRENGRLELDRFDVAGSDAEREAQWTAISTEYAARPFDLAHDLMLRVGVVPFSADQTRLMIHMHHIASDGWSVSIFVKELNRLYETIRQGDEVKLEPLPLQYSDYARWQDDTFRKADYIKGWAFWQDYLRDLPEVHSLPLDAPRPSEQSYRGSVVRSHVPKVVARHLSTLGQEHGATLFMTLYSALTLLLSRYTGEDDVVLGTPIAGRDDENIEAMIGCFVNTLVLRARVDDDDSFEEFLKQCRLRLLDVYEYQHVPFEYLVEALKPSRSLKYNPLFQVMFALHNQERASFSLGEGGSTGLSRDSGTSKFDLSLDAIETADGIGLMWRYASDIFREESILRLDSYFQELLRSIVEDAKRPMRDLSVLPESVRQQLLDFAEEQDGSVPMPASLGAAFERIAEQFPSRLALSAADSRHSYAELMQAVEDFANTLRAAGVGYGDRVGVHLESSPELVITTLALFKLGAVYVPLDPDYPKQRLRYMMADSGARLVLARPAHRARMEDLGGRVLYWGEAAQANSEAVDSVPSTPGLDSVAYIFYTSGSTGEPKGVVVSHGNVLHYHDAVRDLYGVSGEDRVLQFSSPSFDIFIEELTVALLGGGTLVIGDRAAYGSFWGEVEALGITIASLPTAYWHLLCTELGQGTVPANVPLRLLIAGGEKMCVEQLCQWQQVEALAEVRVLNTYGPTEATVIATAYDAASHQPDLGEIPIGAPLRHSHCVIRDARDELVLPGAVGELTIAGSTVALGYLGRPEQSAAAFGQVHDRHGHAHRSYRTGDLVRLNSDGVLEYVGRSDDQIKISGFRISTGEIERQMLKVPGLSVAMVLQDGRGTDARLLAVLVPEVFAQEAQHEALIDQVYHHVKAVLPYYMCPSGYAVLPALPLTDNGKVARSRLLDSSFRVVSSSAVRAPETDTEVALARLWSERLRVDLGSVGRNTSFFEVGGHSLLAIRLLNDIQQIFGKRFSVRQIFETPVLGEFARRIDEQAVHGGATISADSSPSGSAPASFAQKQLWYLDRISEAPGSYNISSLRRFQRELNLRSVEEAVARIVRRHGALRTRFEVRDFDLFQTVAPDVEFLLGTIDASGFPQSEREAVIRQKFQERARQPFGLDTGLLLRMDAVVEEGATVLQLRVHHIAADGWSIDLFWREFDQEYASLESGARTGIPHVALQYIDYSVWQHRQLQDGAWNDLVCFWKQQLGDLPKLHSLALDYPRPEMQSFEGASYLWSIDSACHKRLKALAASSQTSLFTLFHAAFSVLIARRSGNSDVVVATPAANRDRPEVAGMIGLLANLLVLRTNVEPGVRFSDYLQSVRQANIDAQDHQDIPFEYLVETLNPQRSAAHNPLAQIVLNVEQRATAPDLLDAGRFSDQEVAKFDLSLNVVATTQGLTVGLNYCKALFSPFTITRIAEQFSALLDDLSLRPDALICELNLLGENQREQLLELAGQASFCGTEPGDRLYVLDDSSRLVPYGFEGELYVGGPRAVAAFGEDAAGGAGMAPSPISCEPALYFTGNRVRFDHKGVLVASFDGSTRYWKKKLRDLPPRHGLPLMDSGLHERSRESESYDWRLASKTEHLLQVRARDHGLDVWTLLQSGLSLLMSRYAGDADVALGTRGAHRPRSKFELRRDALVLRLDCAAEQTVAEYLEQVRKVNLEALAHCDLSFEEIVERLGVPRDECFNPLFQVMLVLDDAEPSADGESVSAQSIGRIDTAEDMDIVLHVSPGQEGYGLGMSYRKALFPRWLIVQMAEDLTRIFEQLVQGSTARLKDFVLSGSGLAARANQLDGDGHDEQFSCLHALVERQVQRTPDAVALRCDESSISYAELNARANRLAHALIARGVHPGTLVGVCLPRSPDLVVSLLAILKAGAAYVPLDPDYPVERLQYIAADAELACVLGSRDTCAWLEGAEVE
ncbi:MAG: amino acid adenylation domain-containing protein, partial [Pseudomonadota bacterium]|nr:amino acid adenylation domain-containing protein [Pseudomonadota bacterium]